MPRLFASILAVMVFAGIGDVLAQDIPVGYIIPDITLSPNHRYGVTAPKRAVYDTIKDPKNEVIEIKSGHLLGAIQADNIATDYINSGEILPALWSADNSMLLWEVEGKWGPDAVTLVKLGNANIEWQVNILNATRKEILKRVREALPEKYAAVKKQGEGDGSWFKDGFAIACVLDKASNSMKFPLLFHIHLTSNTKRIESEVTVDAKMTAHVNAEGTVKMGNFHFSVNHPECDW